MGVVTFFARHGTAANLLLVALLAAGFWAATGLRVQYLPDVITEEIDVDIRWTDAPSTQVDRAIVGVLTGPLSAVSGVDGLRSAASDGRASFALSFEPGWDMERALDDVTRAVTATTGLPAEADPARIRFDGWRDRVLDIALSADLSRDQLERLGADLTAALGRAGIQGAGLRGRTAPAITVTADPAALDYYGLTLSELAAAVEAQAAEAGAGRLSGEAARLRLGADLRDAQALGQLTIASPRGPVALRALGQIEVAEAGSGRAYFLGARPAVSIAVDRGAGGDALAIENTVRQTVATFLATAPPGVEADIIRNRAEEIRDRLTLLIDNALLGLAAVLLLLFLFLSPAAALWVAAGIPVALAAGFALMWLTGQSLNVIAIYALILCLGIIVDDAIVVAEHAEYRAQHLGEPRPRAAERAARRMLVPVLASTATTIVAFLALTLVGGRFGAFIATIPFVVGVVLLASLAECFLILPHHMGRAAERLNASFLAWPSRAVGRGFAWMRERAFRPLLRGAIACRYAVVLLMLAGILQSAAMIASGEVRWRFFSGPGSNTITANFAMAEGATRADTADMLARVEAAIDRVALPTDAPHPVVFTLGEIGGNAGRGLDITDDKAPELLGSVTIELVDQDQRDWEAGAFIRAVEDVLERPATLEAFSFRSARRGPGGDSLDVVLAGPDQGAMAAAAADLRARLTAFPEVTGVEDSLVAASLDRRLTLTPNGAALGFELADIATTLRERASGLTAATFVSGTDQGAITIRLPEGAAAPGIFDTLRLTAPDGTPALLGEVVHVTPAPAPRVLRRTDGELIVRVRGEITAPAEREAAITQALEADILPTLAATHGIRARLDGLAAQEEAFISDATLGYAACLAAIYAVLALVLASWTRPLTIMLTIPAGLIGVVWGHALWGLPLNIFSAVGFIGLSGIIVNDSIVLTTAIHEKLPRRALIPAVIDAACERLRPVLLTTLTTVIGLAPLLFEGSRQAAFLQPMVLTLISGLSLGLVLILLLVPSLTVIQHDIARALRSARRAPRLLARLRA